MRLSKELKLTDASLNYLNESAYDYTKWNVGDGVAKTTGITCCDEDAKILVPYLEQYAKVLNMEVVRYEDKREGKSVSVYSITKISKNKHINKLKEALKYYNILSNKHIPKDYLMNSRKIRCELLAGLIDSDGGGSNGTIDYVSS
jgi:hypothetical protein